MTRLLKIVVAYRKREGRVGSVEKKCQFGLVIVPPGNMRQSVAVSEKTDNSYNKKNSERNIHIPPSAVHIVELYCIEPFYVDKRRFV